MSLKLVICISEQGHSFLPGDDTKIALLVIYEMNIKAHQRAEECPQVARTGRAVW